MQKLITGDSEENLILSAQPELNLTSYLRTIKRNILPIAAIAGIVTTIVWYSNREPIPIYTGDFKLLVEPVSSEARISDPSVLTGSSKQINLRQV
jgi:uncharacterized protein involved in exopolysaccharide biosynthesis